MNVLTLRESIRLTGRLAAIAQPYWGDLARSMAVGMLASALSLIPPYLSKILIDEAYPSRDLRLVPVIVTAVVIATLTANGLDIARRFFVISVTGRLTTAFGLMAFNHIQHLPLQFFAERQTGEVLSRVGELRSGLMSLSGGLLNAMMNAAPLLLIPPLLLVINWRLALLSLSVYPLTAAITLVSGSLLRKCWKVSAEATAAQNAFQVEALTQIRAVKMGSLEPFQYQRASEVAYTALRAHLRANGMGLTVGLASNVARIVTTAAFTYYAWILIISGGLSLGEFILFSSYLGLLAGPVGQISGFAGTFQQVAVTLSRSFEILDRSTELDPSQALANSFPVRVALRGEIVFKNVHFGYAPGQPVLQGVSLVIPAGTSTAIVGASGAGKTSLLQLVFRTIVPNTGQILVDGRPLTRYDLADFRRQIAVASQDAALFRGTVRENLTFGLQSVSDGAIEDVIRACKLESLLERLPAGLNTVLGESGATISGGQRQRLALARALLRGAPLVILDEALSQIDSRMEEQIVSDLLTRVRGQTVLMVTHRLSAAACADQIVLVVDGRVTAIGPHDTLLGHLAYRQLIDSSTVGDSRHHQALAARQSP
jgi:ABC-type bacteriocin/lantibiotic exporter with double-glycine peptidase domain